jgi:hypothetical protein
MPKKFPILPAHPERICWGCDRYCPSDSMACGNGSEPTPHLAELFGADWMDWGQPPDDAGLAPTIPGPGESTPSPGGGSS